MLAHLARAAVARAAPRRDAIALSARAWFASVRVERERVCSRHQRCTLNCRRVPVEGGRDAASQPPPHSSSPQTLSGGALVLADPPHPSSPIPPATLSAVAAARALGVGPVTVLVAGAGPGVGAAASALAASPGVDAVLTADDPALAHALAEPTAALLAAVTESRGFAVAIAPSSSAGRDVLPRAAALACRDAVTDVISLTPDGAFVRPTYAGAVLETVAYVDGGTRWLTVRPAAFPVASDAAAPASPPAPVPVDEAELDAARAAPAGATFVSDARGDGGGGRPDLGAARVVIAGGRALGTPDAFSSALGGLADRFGGALGASRAAVDGGLAPNELQVGQTGRVVAPDLYIAVGISGAAQHVAGMKDAKCIVAINTDGDAPIFQVSGWEKWVGGLHGQGLVAHSPPPPIRSWLTMAGWPTGRRHFPRWRRSWTRRA